MGANKNNWISNIYISNSRKQIGTEPANLKIVYFLTINAKKSLIAVYKITFSVYFIFREITWYTADVGLL